MAAAGTQGSPSKGPRSGSTIPKIRQEALKWNGWGFKDSSFIYRDGNLEFTGSRYPIGNLVLPYFTQWVSDKLGCDYSTKDEPVPEPSESDYPKSHIENEELLKHLDQEGISFSLSGADRLFRSHGHTLHDVYGLRTGHFPRLVDLVVWPKCHDDVAKIVRFASQFKAVIIPFGGGTSVTEALTVPENEKRTVISIDTSQMNRILWVDESNLLCCAESGIIGQDLERQLKARGYITGHEPDSYEFSSLGGWVATRASGMKKNTYGNIEDLLVHVRMVTPKGVLERHCQVPRISAGPDIHHLALGSEGNFGVVTEVTLKIRPIPPCKKFGSIVFVDFASGVACLREIARQRCQPSSIRLMDNEQFKFGHSLRATVGFVGAVKDSIKSFYLTKYKGFDLNQICIATLLFEGTKEEVDAQEQRIYKIATQFGGLAGGEKNGERGYLLTFVIAYIRDIGLDYHIVAESFETSVPWSHTYNLCQNVKARVATECKKKGIQHHFVTCRVTQTYCAGACVYFYFAFNYQGISDPVKVYEEIEGKARDEILANHGSISHHHGVGKIRRKWVSKTISPAALSALINLKRSIDPENIFASGNIFDTDDDATNSNSVLKAKL